MVWLLCGVVDMWCGCYVVWLICGVVAMWCGCYVVWLICGVVAMWCGCSVVVVVSGGCLEVCMWGWMVRGLFLGGEAVFRWLRFLCGCLCWVGCGELLLLLL